MPEFYEREARRGAAIPYPALASQMFPPETDRSQKLVPFLGAGASLGSSNCSGEPQVTLADLAPVDRLADELGLTGISRQLVELAVRLALKMQALGKISDENDMDPAERARGLKYPPSAGQLAAALAYTSQFDAFERARLKLAGLLHADDRELGDLLRWIANLTEIGPATPPLLSVASYYEYTLPRSSLWQDLKTIFENKTTPTRTHWLMARAAEHYLSLNPRKDYLIITTNYDRLMEIALERIRAPYCVLTVGAADQYVDVRFSPDMQQYLGLSANEFAEVKQEHSQKYPRNFTLEIPRPVVIVYKMHGCLFPEQPGRDTVVLSDEDYIRYLSRMSDNIGMVPSAVTNLTKSCGFLFLGYSFSDWNVRGIYKAVVRHRTAAERMQDYALVREFSSYESAFCRETASRINLLVTDLPKFARRVLAHARPRRRTRLKAKTA